jgi:hypothetical protein
MADGISITPFNRDFFHFFKLSKVEYELKLNLEFASIQFTINTGKYLFKDLTSFNKILIPTFLDLYGRKQRTILRPIDHN